VPVKLCDQLLSYKSWIFDCDGVLLDSNRVKTEAFHSAVLDYGCEYADRLVAYHVEHGGISRFKKFEYFFDNILGKAPEKEEM